MPRTKQFDFEQKKNVAVATIEERLIADNGTGRVDLALAKVLSVSPQTAVNRLNDPDGLKLGEIRKLKLTNRQIIQLVRGKLI